MRSELKKLIDKVDIVSFDLFDTLVFRRVTSPHRVYDYVETVYNYNNKGNRLRWFKEQRIMAELLARFFSQEGEVTLDEIYNFVLMRRLSKNELIRIEKMIEYGITYSNEEMKEVYQYCKETGKRVIVVSDMYLDVETIELILNKNAYNGYDALYLSSVYKRKKKDGELYKEMLKKENVLPSRILHIGDNYKYDSVAPSELGLLTWRYVHKSNKNDLFQNKNYPNMTLDYFANDSFDSIFDELGCVVLCPLLYGFSRWLRARLEVGKYDKVFFLSRDGAIMRKAFLRLYPEYTAISEYVFASRRALIVPILWLNCELNELESIIHFHDRMLVSDFIERVGLSCDQCKKEMNIHGYTTESRVNGEKLSEDPIFRSFYESIKEKVRNNSMEEYKAAKNYWSEKTGDSRKIMLVDIGWNGNMQNAVSTLLNESDTEIEGCYVGVNPRSKHNQIMHGFICDLSTKERTYKRIESISGIFETFFMANHGSVFRYTSDETKAILYCNEYAEPEGQLIDELRSIKSIQKAAIDSIIKYGEHFEGIGVRFNKELAVNNMINLGVNPSLQIAETLGDFRFFNSGLSYLAKPSSGSIAMGLLNSNWRVGYLKRVFKIKMNYNLFCEILREVKTVLRILNLK